MGYAKVNLGKPECTIAVGLADRPATREISLQEHSKSWPSARYFCWTAECSTLTTGGTAGIVGLDPSRLNAMEAAMEAGEVRKLLSKYVLATVC